MKRLSLLQLVFGLITSLMFGFPAFADQPHPWQTNLQEPASPLMEHISAFHHGLLILIIATTIFVLLLLIYVCFRFSAKRNPNPSKTTHNTLLEIIWTALPVVILIVVAVPSFRNLYYMYATENADMTLKIVGHQWYWEYQYPDNDDITFESYMLKDDELKPGQLRLLDVDNPIVLPVGKKVRILVTSADVIHSWAMPSMAVKVDAVPGRLNEAWLQVEKPGTYYGQCSELCGVLHGFMPIVIKALPQEEFDQWLKDAKEKFASNADRKSVYALNANY